MARKWRNFKTMCEAQFVVFDRMFYCPRVSSRENALHTAYILCMDWQFLVSQQMLFFSVVTYPAFIFVKVTDPQKPSPRIQERHFLIVTRSLTTVILCVFDLYIGYCVEIPP